MSVPNFDATRGFVFKNDFVNVVHAGPISFTSAGLCGGMSYAILDYYYAGRTPPQQWYRPADGTVLHQYLAGRQYQSIAEGPFDNWAEVMFNPFGIRNGEFFGWTLDGRSGGRLKAIVDVIDSGKPVNLGLMPRDASFTGHQVIAYGYDLHGASLADFDGEHRGPVSIFVLDPNFPKHEMEMVHDGVETWYYQNWEEVANGRTREQIANYLTFIVDTDYTPQEPPTVDEPVYPQDGQAYELVLYLHTGNDDLNGSGGHINATLNFRDGSHREFENLNGGRTWVGNYGHHVRLRLDQPFRPEDLHSITLSDTFGGGLSGDNWSMQHMAAFAVMGGPSGNEYFDLTYNVGNYTGYPDVNDQLFRFNGDDQSLRILSSYGPNTAPGIVSALLLTFDTGGDDLRGGGNDNVHITVRTKSGVPKNVQNVNRSVGWAGNSQHQVMVHLLDPVPVCELDSLTVRTAFTGGIDGDNWNMDALNVEARGHATAQHVGSHGFVRFTGDVHNVTVPLTGTDVAAPVFSGLPLPVVFHEMCPSDPPLDIQLTVPAAMDECAPAEVTGAITSSNTMPVPTPIGADGRLQMGYGYHIATWTASDGVNETTTTQFVRGLDTTPPVFRPYPAEVTASSCQPSGGTLALEVPEAEDNCGAVTVSGVITPVGGGTQTFVGPDGYAVLAAGEYDVVWTAVDGAFWRATATQRLRVTPALQVSDSFVMRSNTFLRAGSGMDLAGIANSGSGLVELGPQASFGEISSVGPVRVGDRSTSVGAIRSAQWIIVGNDVQRTGPLMPYTSVALDPLPLPEVQFPGTNLGTLQLNADTPPLQLAPGSYYHRVGIHRATGIVLTAGTYYFDRLEFLETGGFVVIDQSAGPVTVVVRQHMGQRGQLQFLGGIDEAFTLVFLGSEDVTLETEFWGTLYAPHAKVNLGSGAGQEFTGRFYARSLELRDNSVLRCQSDECFGASCGPTPPPGASCADGVRNGLETDVDCGGAECGPCGLGRSCLEHTDCETDSCATGVCTTPPIGGSCFDNAPALCPTLSCAYNAGGMNPGHECHRNGYSTQCVSQCEAIVACFAANDCGSGCSAQCGTIANQNGGIGGDAWRAAVNLVQCACQ